MLLGLASAAAGRAWEGPAGGAGAGAATLPPAAVSAAAIRLLATEPGAGGWGAPGAESDDLAALAAWLGEARVVGLGEAEHGTHTLHRLAHRIFAHLAAEAGFDVLALEVDGAHAARLDEWVRGERDDLEVILAERWWGSQIFYDEAMIDLLSWMRERNRRARDRGETARLRVAGFDLKQPALAARQAVEGLRRVDAAAAGRAEECFRRALAPGSFGLFPNVYGFTGELRVPLPPRRDEAPLVVELAARGEGVTYGSAGLLVEAAGVWRAATLDAAALGDGWRTLLVELTAPADAQAIEIALHHRGDGTVWLRPPRVTLGGAAVEAPPLAGIAPRPLLMPRLQANDYRHEVTIEPGTRKAVLRIAADPVLATSRAAAAECEAVVRAAVSAAGDRLERERGAWLDQAARLVRQAVEWRTLGQPNRDVFLAENLVWLARTAFPGRRVLALAHASHTERRAGRMGAYLQQALGADYRTVSMLAGGGEALGFGDLATLEPATPLVPVTIGPEPEGPFEAAVGALRGGDFLLPLAEVTGSPAGRRWLAAAHPRPGEAPDVVIRVERVAPMRPRSVRP